MIEYLIGIHADGKQVAGEANRAAKALGGIESVAARLGPRLGMLFGVGTAAAFIKNTLKMGSEIKTAAEKTGITVEAIQQFKFAAEQSDATLEQVTNGIRFLSRAMAEAAEVGKGDAVDAFKRFGVSLEDIRRLTPDQLFLRLAAAIEKMPASARLTADAMTLLGRGADNLFPAFRNGFAAAAQEATELGIVLSKDVIEKLDDAGDSMERMKSTWGAALTKSVVPADDSGKLPLQAAEQLGALVNERLNTTSIVSMSSRRTDALYTLLTLLTTRSKQMDQSVGSQAVTGLAGAIRDEIVKVRVAIEEAL